MTSTISGFNYPGDKINFVKKGISILLFALLALFYALFFLYLDYNQINFISSQIYTPYLTEQSINSKDVFFISSILFIALFRFLIEYFNLKYNTIGVMIDKLDMKGIFLFIFYYPFSILIIEIFMAALAPLIILIVILAILTYLSRIFGSDFSIFGQGSSNNTYPFPIKPINTIETKRSGVIYFDDYYIYVAENKKIKIFSRNQLNEPLFVLKGHTRKINDIIATNNYLISITNGTSQYGLWDKKNNFTFSSLHSNIEPKETNEHSYIQNIQKHDDSTIFYSLNNKLYINDSNFLQNSRLLLKLDENTIIDYKIDNNYVFLLTKDSYDTSVYIEVRSLSDNTLLNSVEEDFDQNNYFKGIQIGNDNIIIYSHSKIITYQLSYNNVPEIAKKHELNFDNESLIFSRSSKDYFVTITRQDLEKVDFRSRNVLKIYSNSTSFNLLREYPLEWYNPFYIDKKNVIWFISKKNKNIFSYSIQQLIGN